MNRRHLIALAVAFGVPAAVGSAYVVNQEVGHQRTSLVENLPEPAAELRLALADPQPQTPDQALTPPEGLGEASPDILPPAPEPIRPPASRPVTEPDLSAFSLSPEDAPQPPAARPSMELPAPSPLPRPAAREGHQPVPASTTIIEAGRPVDRRSSPVRQLDETELDPIPSPSRASAPIPLRSEPTLIMPSPVRNPETVDEGALAEQARTLAEYLVQTQGQPDPQDARTRYHQIIVVNLETLFDRRQQRYNEEVAQLEAKVRSLK